MQDGDTNKNVTFSTKPRLNLVISRCCFVEDGKEMYQNLKRTAERLFFLIKPFVLWR